MDLLLYKVVITFRNSYFVLLRFSRNEYIVGISETISLEFSRDLKYLAVKSDSHSLGLFISIMEDRSG